MLEVRKTDVYVQWLDGLRDIHARASAFWHGLNAWQPETQGTLSPWV